MSATIDAVDRNRFPLHPLSSDNYFQPNPILNQLEIFFGGQNDFVSIQFSVSVAASSLFQSNFQSV